LGNAGQILSLSYATWFAANLSMPTLIAAGGIRDTLVVACVTVPVTILVQGAASLLGPRAVAWSFMLTGPLFMGVAVVAVKRRVPFAWRELCLSLKPSAIVAILSTVAPLLVVIGAGGPERVTVLGCALAVLGSGLGWLIGLSVTHHPLSGEVARIRHLGACAQPMLSAVAMPFRRRGHRPL
jgi:hypothetical protein